MGAKNPNGVELGTAYVSITTDTSKVGKELTDGLDKAVQKDGKKVGEKLEKEVASGIDGKELGEKFQKAGAAIGVATGAAVTLGLKTAFDQADIQGSIKAQLGTTPEVAAQVAADARRAWESGWGEDLESTARIAAIATQQVNLTGGDEDVALLTAQALALTNTFGDDTQKILESAAQLVKTGMVATMSEGMDAITVGYQSSSRMAEDLLDNVTEYATQARELGMGADTFLGVIGQGLEAGARNGDVIVDALKEFSIRGRDLSKASTEAYDMIGLSSADMSAKVAAGGEGAAEALQLTLDALRAIEDPVKRDAAAVGLFGTKAEDLGDALWAIDPSKLTDLNMEGAATQFATDTMSFEQSVVSMGRTMASSISEALKPVLPMLRSAVNVALDALRWLTANPAVTQVLLAIGAAIGIAAASMWAFNAAALANPVTWIIAAIVVAVGLLVAGIVKLVQNWDAVMTTISGTVRDVERVVGEVAGNIGRFFTDAVTVLKTAWGTVTGFFRNLLTFVLNLFTVMLHGLDVITGGAVTKVVDTIQAAIGLFITGIEIIWSNLTGIFSRATASAGGFASGMTGALSPIGDWFHTTFGGIGEFISGIWEHVVSGAQTMADTIIGIIQSIKTELGNFVNLTNNVGGSIRGRGGSAIPGLAEGGTVTRGGATVVGERGMEILDLPRGSRVTPLEKLTGTGDSGNGKNVHVTVNNPVSEPTSKTVRSASQLVGAALAA